MRAGACHTYTLGEQRMLPNMPLQRKHIRRKVRILCRFKCPLGRVTATHEVRG
jgi:hypothetical protein